MLENLTDQELGQMLAERFGTKGAIRGFMLLHVQPHIDRIALEAGKARQKAYNDERHAERLAREAAKPKKAVPMSAEYADLDGSPLPQSVVEERVSIGTRVTDGMQVPHSALMRRVADNAIGYGHRYRTSLRGHSYIAWRPIDPSTLP